MNSIAERAIAVNTWHSAVVRHGRIERRVVR
jgi:hypothetical protein